MDLKFSILLFALYMFPARSQTELDTLQQPGVFADKGYASLGVIGMPRPKGVIVYTEMGHSNKITSNFNNPGLSSTGETRKTESWVAKIRAPLVVKDNFKLFLGLKYKHQDFSFKDPSALTNAFHQNLEDKSIRTVGFSLRMVNSFNRNKFLISRATFRLNGDFGKKDLKQHFKQSYTLLLGFKLSPEKIWGFGASYSNSFGRPGFYPLLFVDYKIKPKWGLRVLLPVSVQLLYLPNEKDVFSLNNKFEGDNYNMNFPTLKPDPLYLENADFKSFITYEREIYDFLWLGISGGVNVNINFNIYDSANYFDRTLPVGNTDNLVIINDIPTSAFFRVGLFLVPPSKWLK